jgi:hypothetical protein
MPSADDAHAASRASIDHGGVAVAGRDVHPCTKALPPPAPPSALSTSLVRITAGASAARQQLAATLQSGPSMDESRRAAAAAAAAAAAPPFSAQSLPLPPHPRQQPTTQSANGSGTRTSNNQHPRTSAPSSASSAAAAGLVFPSVLLPSMIPPLGSTVRPSTAIEAQVHASIKGTSFAVPPVSSSLALQPSSTTLSSSDVPTPDVFRNRRLRSGKWIKEEELYADLLIEQFEGGVAPDCPNGVTLRAYLSRKLHCAPMRISKKYAGKGIGKLVFVSKAGSDGAAAGPSSSSRQALVKEREDRFYKAAFRSNDFLGVRVRIVQFGRLVACKWMDPAQSSSRFICVNVDPVRLCVWTAAHEPDRDTSSPSADPVRGSADSRPL